MVAWRLAARGAAVIDISSGRSSGSGVVVSRGMGWSAGEQMAQLAGLGGKITRIETRAGGDMFDALGLDVELVQRRELARIVGHKFYCAYPKMSEHRCADSVIAQIIRKAELMICFNGVSATFLQVISADLVDESDTSAFLSEIKQDTPAFLGNALESTFELRAAVAALAEQGVTGQAFGVQPGEHGFAVTYVAKHHGQMFFACAFFYECVQPKAGPRGRQRTTGNVLD